MFCAQIILFWYAVSPTGEKTSSFSPLTPLSGLSRATPEPLGLSRRIIAPALRGATACGVLSTSLAAYCSVSAHPRNCCCSAFALSGQKFIRMRPARSAATASHPWRRVTTVVIHRKYPIRLIPGWRHILLTGAVCGSSVCMRG